VELELDVGDLGDFSGGVGDLVFGALVAEFEDASVFFFSTLSLVSPPQKNRNLSQRRKEKTYRLGSILFPAALLLNFFIVAGPTFAK